MNWQTRAVCEASSRSSGSSLVVIKPVAPGSAGGRYQAISSPGKAGDSTACNLETRSKHCD